MDVHLWMYVGIMYTCVRVRSCGLKYENFRDRGSTVQCSTVQYRGIHCHPFCKHKLTVVMKGMFYRTEYSTVEYCTVSYRVQHKVQ